MKNKYDVYFLLGLMAATFLATLFYDLPGAVCFGFMTLAWATAMSKS
jgi:hypothetical protein